ncbi:MAG: HD domain-containing protein [Firmicutes bacterium]|nr:HD domain-containing protein [Bacillota bacterium]
MANKILTVKDLKNDPEVQALINVTELQLEVLGYTEHSNRHLSIVSNWTGDVLRFVNATPREINLGELAGYLHDIGNAVHRNQHAQSGAMLAYQLLTKNGLGFEDAAEIMLAIGNHDEDKGTPVSKISAALIIADKADVHKSRVRKIRTSQSGSVNKYLQDIHDRVNTAAENSFLLYNSNDNEIVLNLTINTNICTVMDYFEIYFSRTSFSRSAAQFLKCKFGLIINGVRLL